MTLNVPKFPFANNPPIPFDFLVKGSYSAYADPLARRAIAVSMAPLRNEETDPNHPVHPSRLQTNIMRRRIRDPMQRAATTPHYNHGVYPTQNYRPLQQYPPGAHPQMYRQLQPEPDVPTFRGQIPPQGRIVNAQFQQQSPQYNNMGYECAHDFDSYGTKQFFHHPSDRSSSPYEGSIFEHPHQSFDGDVVQYQSNGRMAADFGNGLSGDDMFQSPPPAAPPVPQQPLIFLSPSQLYPTYGHTDTSDQQQRYYDEYDKENTFESAWGEPEPNLSLRGEPRRSFEEAFQTRNRPFVGNDMFMEAVDDTPSSNSFTPRSRLNLHPRGVPVQRAEPVAYDKFRQFVPPLPQQYRHDAPNVESVADQFPDAPSSDNEFHQGMDIQFENPIRTGPNGATDAAQGGIARFQKTSSPPNSPPFARQLSSSAQVAGANDFLAGALEHADRRRGAESGGVPNVCQNVGRQRPAVAPGPDRVAQIGKSEEGGVGIGIGVVQFQTWKASNAADRRPASVPLRLSTEPTRPVFGDRTNDFSEESHHHASHMEVANAPKPTPSQPLEVVAAFFHDELDRNETSNYPLVRTLSACVHPHSLRLFNEGVEVDLDNFPLSRPSSPSVLVGNERHLRQGTTTTTTSSTDQNCFSDDDDDDLDLVGKTSLWGRR